MCDVEDEARWFFGAVLTMPGIAGVVLTIGMAVDSNVLIFEHREELKTRKVRQRSTHGWLLQSIRYVRRYSRHHRGVVHFSLSLFGTPPVKGFATTLVLGLITNLFTSVFVSRVVFD
jgi:preprotein translocase subunit SecD